MQLSTLMIVIMVMAALAPFANSVISLGGILLTTALITTMVVSTTVNSWFAFILFLIYITGLLVLFSYMMAMSPNSYISPKNKPKMALIMTIIVVAMSSKSTLILTSMKGSKTFEEEVTAIFEPSSTVLYWVIAIILMFALMMAVTVCFKAAKPLRPFNP